MGRAKSKDLHGSAPDQASTVLLIIDMFNELNFPEGKDLLQFALPVAANIAQLKSTLKKQNIPVIYANDNFARWRSDRQQIIDRCLRPACLGKALAEALLPDGDDYF